MDMSTRKALWWCWSICWFDCINSWSLPFLCYLQRWWRGWVSFWVYVFNSDLPSLTTLLWVSRYLLIHDLSHASLRKQLTFGAATTGFPAKWRLRNKRRNSILMMCHYLDLGSASDWSCRVGNLIQPIRSTTQIWVVMCHQYGISVLVSQTSFGGETSGGVTKCQLFSQANLMLL